MSFIDRYEAQLVSAAHARRQRMPRHRRVTLLVALGVSITAPALAATGIWRPQIGDAEHGSPSITAEAPPASALDHYAVLKRPETAKDRGALTQGALRLIGPGVTGVRTGYIRLLRDEHAGGAVVLIPVAGFRGPFPTALTQPDETQTAGVDGLCLFVADPTGGGASGCRSLDELLNGVGRLPQVAGSRMYGLVPDGVARVEVTLAEGPALSANVRNNLFVIDLSAQHFAPPARPARAREVRWLDSSGALIERIEPPTGP
jgi:hypothetical protein